MKFTQTEKRQLLIYGLTAFGVPYLMGLVMAVVHRAGGDTSIFANAQMYAPAAGVMLAMLFTHREDSRMPRKFYISFLLLSVLLMGCCVMAALMPQIPWLVISNLVILAGSLICWLFYFLDGKHRRTAYGLRLTGTGGKWVVGSVVLFLVLYFARIAIAGGLAWLSDPSLTLEDLGINSNLMVVGISLISLPINFLLVYTAFFGEEYGWRGFLQPLMQRRFGARKGVVLLGVLWGLWHLPLNLFFYSPQTSLQSIVNQIVVCISLGAFFGWAYLKTKTIWVPVILHFLNNNLIAVLSSPDAISNQVISWGSVLFSAILMSVLFLPFLASRLYSDPQALPKPLPFPKPEQDAQES